MTLKVPLQVEYSNKEEIWQSQTDPMMQEAYMSNETFIIISMKSSLCTIALKSIFKRSVTGEMILKITQLKNVIGNDAIQYTPYMTF